MSIHQLTPQVEDSGRKSNRKVPDNFDIYNDEDIGTKTVPNVKKVKLFLEQKQLIPGGEELMIQHLCQALILIAV